MRNKTNEVEIEQQIAELREEVQNIVTTVKDLNLDGIKGKMQDFYEEAKHRGIESYHEAKEKLNDFQQQLAGEVRKKPLQSMVIAGGLGLIFGLIIRR